MPKKLFISQPMNGKTKEEILSVREKAIELAKEILKEDIEVLDSYFPDYAEKENPPPLWYLGKSLELLSEADAVYFADGWGGARGCRIEHICAFDYGIAIIRD